MPQLLRRVTSRPPLPMGQPDRIHSCYQAIASSHVLLWNPAAMASLLIRKLDDTLHARLKARALQHGRSLEGEVRETLRLALAWDASV